MYNLDMQFLLPHISLVPMQLLIGIALIILFSLLTYALSTFFFYRTLRSNGTGLKPATLPYWLPGIYHALNLVHGPAGFFADIMYSGRRPN